MVKEFEKSLIMRFFLDGMKRKRVWLSTRLGGIIIGKIRGEVTEIALPDLKTLLFRKSLSRIYELLVCFKKEMKNADTDKKNHGCY